MLKRDFVVRKPCLHRSYEILAVPETDDLQFQSEGRTLRLKPCDSSGLLHQLISLLDGTRTVDDILNEMSNFDESQILDSLQQLFEARLVEDAAPDATGLSEDQRQFYSSQLTKHLPDLMLDPIAQNQNTRNARRYYPDADRRASR